MPASDAQSSPPKVAHDPSTPEALVAFMCANWAPAAPLVAGPADCAPFTARRRTELSERFPDDWLVIPSGSLKVRANDTDYPFRPGTDFFWLTGWNEPDAVLVFEPTATGHEVVLFTPPRMDRSTAAFFADRRYGELWVGPRVGLEAGALLGVTTAPLDELAPALKRIQPTDRMRVLRDHDPAVDALLPSPETTDAELSPDDELAVALSEMRLVKDEHEVRQLERAVAATIRGFEDAAREMRAATALDHGERWIEGTFWRRARTEGNDVGYGSIVAAGAHACTLHWVQNTGGVREGDLVLLDMGVESDELYTADVTRTLPVSGRFTPEQRDVYEAVHAAQLAALAEVKPGAAFLAPHRAAMRVLAEWLVASGILQCSADEALAEENQFHRRYTLHGVSHMLGIDVHDCARARTEQYRQGTLRAGMCLTVEPGLYFQPDDLTVPEKYRGIGVRIEDDVLVTDEGHRNLSAALPAEASAVEAWMAGLQP